MVKKGILAVLVLLGLGFLLARTDVWSYAKTSAAKVQESVKESVPISFEIDRARDMVRDLVPDIRKNMHVIAKEEVEVDRLAKQIDLAENNLGRDREELMRLKADLSSGQTVFQYAGRSYSQSQVKVDLANRFERYKTSDATLGSLREMHEARVRSLEAARQKLEGMLATKRQLEVDVEHLQARLKMLEAAETASQYTFDDSQLSRAKELVSGLRTRLEVAEKMVQAEETFHDEIPLDQPAPENIVDEVTDYFQPRDTHVAEAIVDGTR